MKHTLCVLESLLKNETKTLTSFKHELHPDEIITWEAEIQAIKTTISLLHEDVGRGLALQNVIQRL